MSALKRSLNLGLAWVSLTLVLTPSISNAESYDKINNIPLLSYGSKGFVVDGFSVNYSFSSIKDDRSRYDYLSKIISDVSDIVFEYIGDSGIDAARCNHSHNILIYEINQSDLNDSSRFSKHRYRPNSKVIYGFWEPVENNDVIVVSYQKLDIVFLEIISHEIAHYWYNRLEIKKSSSMTHEDFAKKIEEISVNRMVGFENE